ncbi:hypothetical protein CWI37_1735p0010 [Hamiltosporidium tvaerminnensis]|uniref:Uncharacterized protein n=1 Tax=Hamiltosporidium tvaerminnensis TaxID=1176355 RepID=A0A4Q9KUI1_9MICR|nr:hypothetical protein LUQ84_003214 [Hamiltosporidium tvaerminnensis]TBT98483.1 hypothetical protein CWI37_1735p0010 [Hamiltosporidium tvaerminnensis]
MISENLKNILSKIKISKSISNEDLSFLQSNISQDTQKTLKVISLIQNTIDIPSSLIETIFTFYTTNFTLQDTISKSEKPMSHNEFIKIFYFYLKNDHSFIKKIINYLENSDTINSVVFNMSLLLFVHIGECGCTLEPSKFTTSTVYSLVVMKMNEENVILFEMFLTYISTFISKYVIYFLKKNSQEKENKFFYKIFSFLNKVANIKDLSYFTSGGDSSIEFYEMLSTLVLDEESAIQCFSCLKTSNTFSQLFSAVQSLSKLSIYDSKKIQPTDKKYILILLEVSNKILEKSFGKCNLYFLRYINILVEFIFTKIDFEIKNMIFIFLSFFKEKEEIENWIKCVEYCLKEGICEEEEEGFLRLCYVCITEYEDLDYEIFKRIAFVSFIGLSSSNPNSVFNSLKILLKCEIQSLIPFFSKKPFSFTSGLKNTFLKDARLIGMFIELCCKLSNFKSSILEPLLYDVSFMNLILSYPQKEIFNFVSIFSFKEFSIFLNEIFSLIFLFPLEGLKYLERGTKECIEFCRFITERKEYFNKYIINLSNKVLNNIVEIEDLEKCSNNIIENNDDHLISKIDEINILIISIYNNILDFYFIDVSTNRRNETFFINFVPCDEIYEMYAKLTIKGHLNGFDTDYYKLEITNVKSIRRWCDYLKCRMVVGDNIEDILANVIGGICTNEIEDLIGFYNGVQESEIPEKKSKSNLSGFRNSNSVDEFLESRPLAVSNSLAIKILYSFKKKNNEMFLKYFENATDWEKFLLFFILDYKSMHLYESQFSYLLTFECKRTSKKNDKNSQILLSCSLHALIYLKSLNSAISMLKILNIPNEFYPLLSKINLMNLLNSGTNTFDLNLLKLSDVPTQIGNIILMWTNNICDKIKLKEWASSIYAKGEEYEYMNEIINEAI